MSHSSVYLCYFLFFILQKKCHTLKNGSLIASAGKYLTSLISLYTLWRLCPSCDFPCFPKFPASSTSFNTNFPYFSFGGTISREADMPNTTCMIYIMANITRSPGIRMQNLRKSKKTFCCFSTLFLRHIPEE